MNVLNEYEIMQNNALGALALSAFTIEFYKNTNNMRGPTLQVLMPVLPMVLHEDTALTLHNKKKQGGFYRSVYENRAISVGLQQRMQSMADQTFQALNFAFASKLLNYDASSHQVIPQRRTSPLKFLKTNYIETRRILSASERLGYWFSEMGVEQIAIILNLRW